ncbi:EAL domain-containing protein [Mangrovicella endophytica]|uniref:EAL domain-containing protein n=1 Tax=Mangrovicella endophytica TaxID=2066697 RepID=UPI000C9DDF02|nr:EAL domain-containing protein [Mangrovicella endophytica]
MSINLKLIIAGLAIGLVTIVVGVLSHQSQMRSREYAAQVYDQGLLPLGELFEADSALTILSDRYSRKLISDPDKAPSAAEVEALTRSLGVILGHLRVGAAGALSDGTRLATRALIERLSLVQAADGKFSLRLLSKELAESNIQLNDTLQRYRADVTALRAEISAGFDSLLVASWIELALAVIFCLLVALILSRTIVPPIRNAVSIATSIAGGNIENEIVPAGRGETGELLAALAMMQKSILSNSRRIEKLMTAQASRFDNQITTQHNRFEAALNNMTQGLCMFDRDMNLVVFNEPFAQMFPNLALGAPATEVLADSRLHDLLAPHETGFFVHAMRDGRMIAVSRRGMTGGGLVVTFENITEKHRTAKQLEHLASHDWLTDLANRHQFTESLERMLRDQPQIPIAIHCLDLNGFKSINDTYGHPCGDALLKLVGDTLVACVGPNDLVARLGGDEFAIIQTAPESQDVAEALARRVVDAMSEPMEAAGRRVSIGVSIGVIFVPKRTKASAPSADVVIKNCDLALYRAKSERRSGYQFFEPGMREHLELRRLLERDLEQALDREEFELFYQPFVDVDRKAVSGFEALLRWRHAERGMVSPMQFIPLAEELGLIERIGLWALRSACEQAAAWPGDLKISVNLSPVQFRSPTLVADVVAILRETGLEAKRLQLEVTESVFLDDTDGVLTSLRALRQLGVLISMDDFGTGYSSLGYLSRFPFDKIKIDQSFVRDLKKPENIAIVRAVMGLSRAMKIAVIAEGIETREQLETLYREGCREMQGYHFSKPRPAADLPKVLREVAQYWRDNKALEEPRQGRDKAA